jgi:hypothetical protein
MGEEWVRTYLNSLGEAIPDISDFFMSELIRIPLRFIESDSNFEKENGTSDTFEVPLIVIYDNKTFKAPFQPGYLSCLKREKKNSHYAFVFAKNDEYDYFWINYGRNFQR